jgi:hypothetical protein
MASSKGKGKLDVAPDDLMEATSNSMSISQLLSTPEPFNIDDMADVNQEIERLEALAANHHWLNTNSRFLTHFGRLTSQKERLEQESIGNRPPDLMDALEASLDQIINVLTANLSMSTTSPARESSNESVKDEHPRSSCKQSIFPSKQSTPSPQPPSRKRRTQLPKIPMM